MDRFDDLETKQKVNYDARLNYYKVVQKYLESIAQAALVNDIRTEFYLLRDLYALLSPYLSDNKELITKVKSIKNKLNLALNRNSKQNSYSIESIKDMMFDFRLMLYKSGKHIWLPTQDDDEEEFSFDAIMEGSE